MRFAVIGSPVAHSKSPAMQQAAYRALGMTHVYAAIETSPAEVPERVDALRQGIFAGLNVTVPHKTAVLALADSAAPSAAAIGAANTLVRLENGQIVAHNTDAPALASELQRLGAKVSGRSALVLGAGGAARAAVFALVTLGARRIFVRARAPGSIASMDARVIAQALDDHEIDDDLAAVVQATSCGMTGAAPGQIVAAAVGWSTLPRDAVALDVVYAPRDTPFMQSARNAGIPCDDGLGMLVAQGAIAFALWLGVNPPRDVMLAAVGAMDRA